MADEAVRTYCRVCNTDFKGAPYGCDCENPDVQPSVVGKPRNPYYAPNNVLRAEKDVWDEGFAAAEAWYQRLLEGETARADENHEYAQKVCDERDLLRQLVDRLKDLLMRVDKYAREDRAQAARSTRFARVMAEIRKEIETWRTN